MIVLLIVFLVGSVVGTGLLATMFWRDDPFLGAIAMMVLNVTGIVTMAYGMLSSL